MKTIVVVVCLLIGLSGCQKDGIIPIQDDVSSLVDAQDSSESISHLKSSSLSLLNATHAGQIPSQMFAVNPIYKIGYYHYQQPDKTSCSWTSYVNCINCIVTSTRNYCYPTPISSVRQRCTYSYPNVKTYGANHILALEWYVGRYDEYYVYYSRKSSTNRWYATREMLAHINSYHTPFVVRSSMGSVGHYRVVFSIDWKQSESSSTVYYTDCWYANTGSFNSNIRSMSLYSFLNTMISGAECYNMLFMWPK